MSADEPAVKRAKFAAQKILEGKVAVVTGAAGCMGRHIAKALLGQGAQVLIADFNLDKAKEVAEDLCQVCKVAPSMAVGVFINVLEEESVEKMFADMKKDYGKCDILVNSAGIMLPGAPSETISKASFDKVLGVNVTGTFLCAREAFKLMKKQANGGRIFNIGSIAAIASRPDAAAYTTSKFAVNGLSQSLAIDGRAHKIAVTAIHPGNVLSDLIPPHEVASRRAAGEDFMEPDCIGETVLSICMLPDNATCLQTIVMPTVQALIGRG